MKIDINHYVQRYLEDYKNKDRIECHVNTELKCSLKGFPNVWDIDTCKQCQKTIKEKNNR